MRGIMFKRDFGSGFMKVDVSDILKNSGASLKFFIEEEITGKDELFGVSRFLSPVKVEGTITSFENVLKVNAKGIVTILATCAKCLKDIDFEIYFEVNEDFSTTGNEEEAEAFTGEIIDLSSVVNQSIVIALPMKIVCDDDCKGLCPVCGKDLNEEVCNCDTSAIDPRFESLRSLFKLDEEV